MIDDSEQTNSLWRKKFIKKAGAAVAAAAASGMMEDGPPLHRGMLSNCQELIQIHLRQKAGLTETQREFQRIVFKTLYCSTRVARHQDESKRSISLKPGRFMPPDEFGKVEPRSSGHDVRCAVPRSLPDNLKSFLIKTLASLLRLVVLETDSQRIQSPYIQTRHRAPLQDLNEARRFEPRIEYIHKEIVTLLRYVCFYVDRKRVKIVSFQLKNLQDWLVDTRVDKSVSDPYASVLQYLSWDCHAACRFCLHRNDPPGYWTKAGGWRTSKEEIVSRINAYDPEAGIALFRTQDYNYHEILTHPDVLEVIRTIRRKTKKIIGFATNGVVLTERFIERLAEFQPLYLMVSLNSANPNVRQKLMADSRPEVAIDSLPLLRKFKISYSVSIVPWHENAIADIEGTIHYADKNDAYLIRVNLDGYSKHFDAGAAHTLINESPYAWRRVIECVRTLRREVDTPIVFQPSHLEENLFDEFTIRATINGIAKNSPASRSGLRCGDKIIQIDDFVVGHKALAINMLRMYHQNGIEQFDVKVRRFTTTCTFGVRENFRYPIGASKYPHFTELGSAHEMNPIYPYGIILQPTLNPLYLWKIAAIIAIHRAKRVLFLSSYLMKPTFSRLIAETGFPWNKDVQFQIEVPNNERFLGGSVVVGDLLVADDFIESIRRRGSDTDLVIIPSTPFNNWRRDISGKVYKEIERACGVPVELLETEVITVL